MGCLIDSYARTLHASQFTGMHAKGEATLTTGVKLMRSTSHGLLGARSWCGGSLLFQLGLELRAKQLVWDTDERLIDKETASRCRNHYEAGVGDAGNSARQFVEQATLLGLTRCQSSRIDALGFSGLLDCFLRCSCPRLPIGVVVVGHTCIGRVRAKLTRLADRQ
jgi:hypothetical protein